MKKSKNIFIIGIVLISVCFGLIKCNSEGKNDSCIVEYTFPEKYKGKTQYLAFDIERIHAGQKDVLYECYAKKSSFQPERIINAVYSPESDKNQDIDNRRSGNESYTYISGNSVTYLSNSDLQSYVMKNFSIEDAAFSEEYFESVLEMDGGVSLNRRKTLERKLADIGLENLTLYRGFKLKFPKEKSAYATALETKSVISVDQSSNECIYWLGIEVCQNIPVFTTIYYEGITDAWAPVQIVESDRGIEQLNVDYYFQFEKSEAPVNLLPFEDIVSALDKEYSMILTDKLHSVVEAGLYFWINVDQEDTRYRMEPVWVFTIHEYREGEEDNYKEYQEMIHAETGNSVEIRG